MAIMIALQQKPETAQRLADKFEVNKRTIMRDMQALSEMGIPLYAVPGPTGGFRLMDGFRLPPLQFDSGEALTVLFALNGLTKMSDTPFKHARWTVMDKIRSALPEETLKQVEPLLERVELEVAPRSVQTPHLAALLALTAEAKWLKAMYRSENHRREVWLQPLRMYAAHGFWYCEAYSRTHGEARTFRVDRFESVSEADMPAELRSERGPSVPATRDHAVGAVPGASDDSEDSMTRIVAKLTYRGALLAEQDFHFGEQVKQLSDDAWEVDFRCPGSEWAWATRFFYGLGMDAEVIEPPSLRQAIAGMARQVHERYQGRVTDDGGSGSVGTSKDVSVRE